MNKVLKFCSVGMALAFLSLSDVYCQEISWASLMKHRLELMADSLSQNLKPWKVPNRRFRVEKYGATGDGKTLNTVAIQKAIDECSKKVGDSSFSKGDYVTGTFEIKSGVMIEIAKGARILGSTDIKDYPEKLRNLRVL